MKHLTKFVVAISLVTQNYDIESKTITENNHSAAMVNLGTIDERFSNVNIPSSLSKNYISYFELIEKEIQVSVVGSIKSSITLKGSMSFFEAKIAPSEIDKLSKLLYLNDVDFLAIQKIKTALTNGVITSEQCKGKKSTCIVYEPDLAVVIDYYNNSLRLFIPSNWFKVSDKDIVLGAVDDDLLVSRFYSSFSYTNYFNYYLRSENIFGLGPGYAKYDLNASNRYSKINQFNYNYDADNYSLTGGIISNNQRLGVAGQNTLVNEQIFGFDWSNQRLLKVKSYQGKRIEFFSPSDGVLSVYRNQELIYQSNILSGKNGVAYSLLPYGNYRVSYDIKKDDIMVFQGDTFVMNSDTFDASRISTYVRMGMKEERNTLGKSSFVFDSGISFPLYQQQSAIFNTAYVEDEFFAGLGYYANINVSRFNVKYTMSNNASQIQAEMYSNFINLSLTKNEINDERQSYLGAHDSLIISTGTTSSFGRLTAGISANYNDFNGDEYLSYSINSNFSFESGIGLSASYNGGDNQDTLMLGLSIPLSNTMRSQVSYINNQDSYEISNQLTDSYKVNDFLSVNSGLTASIDEHKKANTDAYVNGNFRNKLFTSSVGVRKHHTGNVTYNGSFSTTAYVTENGYYFKDTQSNYTSAIEVVGLGEKIRGTIELSDKVTGRTKDNELLGDTLLAMKPYTQVDVDYDFDDDEFALDSINVDKNELLNLLPGKIHYVNVMQHSIGNILIVSNNPNSQVPVCSGLGCLDSTEINNKVRKFRIKDGEEFRIHQNDIMCFGGTLTQGQTLVKVC